MAEATIPILEMKNVGKTYSQNGRSIEALRGANLRVKKGEFICLIGASGCGKSTLLRMAAGFETATLGDNLMWGVPISGPGPSRGMVFQDYGLFPWLNVRDNIGFGPKSRWAHPCRNPRKGRSFHRAYRAAALRRCLSTPALRRDEATCRHRARARQRRRG